MRMHESELKQYNLFLWKLENNSQKVKIHLTRFKSKNEDTGLANKSVRLILIFNSFTYQ